jgi:RNA-directed DNA polymerase
MSKNKPFSISEQVVREAFERVKANKGASGVDDVSLEDFEKDLDKNLYKIWNRMSSGSYIPPPVRVVEIPKGEHGKRKLGIPTVSDRVAQMVVKIYLEPTLEPHFHPDSYGYRPRKSALDAVGVARKRCWRYDWVLDLDIKGFFDNLDHEQMMSLLRRHTECKWIQLYVERWLKAPAQLKNGTLTERNKGTPQGGVISPLLANLYLHHAFDEWMQRTYPAIPFERYADDAIVHCESERMAIWIKGKIERRLREYKLELHPEKTKVIYCKDDDRKGRYSNEKFDFLGFEFRPRRSKNRWGKFFINFSPAVSRKAMKGINRTIREWHLHLWSYETIGELARRTNPSLQGWINYYGRYYKSALYPVFQNLDRILVKWAMRKYKKLRRHQRRATDWLRRIAKSEPNLFAHWRMYHKTTAGQ